MFEIKPRERQLHGGAPQPPCNPGGAAPPLRASLSWADHGSPRGLCQQRGSQAGWGLPGLCVRGCDPILDEPLPLPPELLLLSSVTLCALALLQARYRTTEPRDGLEGTLKQPVPAPMPWAGTGDKAPCHLQGERTCSAGDTAIPGARPAVSTLCRALCMAIKARGQ